MAGGSSTITICKGGGYGTRVCVYYGGSAGGSAWATVITGTP